jgi:hypothetical protein
LLSGLTGDPAQHQYGPLACDPEIRLLALGGIARRVNPHRPEIAGERWNCTEPFA